MRVRLPPSAHCMQQTPQDEYLDIVDENDTVIGKQLRSEAYAHNRSNFRVVNVLLINPEGKLWIPRRAANKRIFPLALDMSMGGHVEHGETYAQALERELSEELNLKLNETNYRFLGDLSPSKNNTSAFMKVYEIAVKETPKYNPTDFIEYYWLTPQELLNKLANGDRSKEDLPKIVKAFYS